MAFAVRKIVVEGGGGGGLQVSCLEEHGQKIFHSFDKAMAHARHLESPGDARDVKKIESFFSEGGIEVSASGEGCPCATHAETAQGMTCVNFPLDVRIRSCDCIMDAIESAIDEIFNRGTLVQVVEADDPAGDTGAGTLRYESRLMVDLDVLRETGNLKIGWEESCWLDTGGLLEELSNDLDYILNHTRKVIPKYPGYLDSYGPEILDEILDLVACMPEDKRRHISCDQQTLQKALRHRSCGRRVK